MIKIIDFLAQPLQSNSRLLYDTQTVITLFWLAKTELVFIKLSQLYTSNS